MNRLFQESQWSLKQNDPSIANICHEDRLARAAKKAAGTIPVVDPDPMAASALKGIDTLEFFTQWAKTTDWKNEVTVKT
jgi:hypothetical protein